MDVSSESMSQLSEAWTGPVYSLFRSISVIRVFCHPEVRNTIRAILDSKMIITLAIEELKKL